MGELAKFEEELNPRALKHKFGRDLLSRIADSIVDVYPEFDRRQLLLVMPDLESLEMKPRVRVICDALRRLLPDEYPRAINILLTSASNSRLEGFDFWPYTEFVQSFGLDDLDISLDALRELTKVFTSEWAVRPFITLFPKETMKYLKRCTRDNDVNVRRWASEGSRPRLPWGERLQEFIQDPRPTLPILEALKYDDELFVRRSVANHLNDIAKDHPGYVVDTLERWKSGAKGDDLAKVEWIIERSLRTLIKSGHSEALRLVGVSEAKVNIEKFEIVKTSVQLGGRLDFKLAIRSTANEDQKLVIDYIVHFMKANGRTSPKVFKLKTVQLPAGGALDIEKRHPVRQITTRRFYGGSQALEIQINGVAVGRLDWNLEL